MDILCLSQRSGEQSNGLTVSFQGYRQCNGKGKKKEVENHYDEVQEEDLEVLESEIFLESVRNTVLHDISTPYHPIKVGSRNVCELSRTKKLNTLKVAELRKKSEILQLAVDRPPSRKKSFIKPLETYAKTCTCLKILKRCS